MRRGPGIPGAAPLLLHGEEQTLQTVQVDGSPLTPAQFTLSPATLTIAQVPAQFTAEVESVCNPAANSALDGLYLTSSVFCTQCEAEGFRRITYFPDRPDGRSFARWHDPWPKPSYPFALVAGDLAAPEDAFITRSGRRVALSI